MILALAGGYAAVAALAKSGFGLALGVIVSAAGAMELHGVERLNARWAEGWRWLMASQLYLLTVIVIYATWRYQHIDFELMRQALTPELKQALAELEWREDDFLRLANHLTYGLFGAVSVAYQGGMAWYYWRKRTAVRLALADES